MDLLLNFAFIATLIVVANLITRSGDARWRYLFTWWLLALSVPMFLVGVFLVVAPEAQWEQLTAVAGQPLFALATNRPALGVTLQLMALWSITLSFRSTRTHLARYAPVDPDSTVHLLALVSAGWLAGASLIQVSQNSIAQLMETIGALAIGNIVLEQSFFVLLALLGVGLLLRRSPSQVWARLGLGPLTARQLMTGLWWIIVLVLIQTMTGLLWYLINPEQVEEVGALNSQLQSEIDTVWKWLLLALATGVGEEILFRGALQPVFGLWPTAVLFALVHIQYGFLTPATLALLLFALVLGRLRQQHNTTLAVFVHIGYNFTLGMMTLAAP